MTRLTTLIDNLPPPELPASYSAHDCQFILRVLELAKQQARPYEGDYKAPWLLNAFTEPEWITTHRGREEMVRKAWKNAIRVDWRVRLPNGALLTDRAYEDLLNTNKRVAFLVRSGLVGRITAPVTWLALVSVQLQLTKWLVLHERRFQPEIYGFRLLDQPALDALFGLLSTGGWTCALEVPQRLLVAFHERAFGHPCPDEWLTDPYAVPPSRISQIIGWLSRRDFYEKVCRGVNIGRQYLKRERLADLIGESAESIRGGWKFAAFCRQFEPDLVCGTLLTNAFQTTELPDQKTRTIKEVVESGVAENSLQSIARHISRILSAHRHDPEHLPEPGLVSVRNAQALAEKQTRPSSHTPFMPVNVGLAYLNEAIRFVHVYGDALVGYYLAVAATRTAVTTNNELDAAVQVMAHTWRIASGESIASTLNIDGFERQVSKPDFNRLRSQPTLIEALRVLIGSCIVSIALLKPSRLNELTHLKRHCLRENDGGYYINFALGKSNVGDAYQQADRPIPVIAAKAIRLLQRLGDGLVELYADQSKIADNLFYLPKLDGTVGALAARANLLTMHLDILCDYVGLPSDSQGRRWYVRIHEMRKWFLLLLFWSGRYDVLDAARWIAGHTDVKHMYSYIEREFPGEELPRLEAEYAVERLRSLEARGRNGNPAEEAGLDELYGAVLRHFNVASLAMVPEVEWSDYVTTLRKVDGFVLEPHSIYADNGVDVIGINVSFVLREGGQ
jgi:hypothetical protein